MYDQLIRAAYAAADQAYAPYSKFRVGAAVLLEDGTVITGSNQENISYPLTVCAERVALNYAKAQHPNKKVLCMVLVSPSSNQLITPCGACRAVMSEVVRRQAGEDFKVISANHENFKEYSVRELLPFDFDM